MPGWVMVPEAISPVGPERPGQHAGFLGAAYDPYRVGQRLDLEEEVGETTTPMRGRGRRRRGKLLVRQESAAVLEENRQGIHVRHYVAERITCAPMLATPSSHPT